MTTVHVPEKWLETAIRGIKDYVNANINTGIYNVVMEFPAADIEAKKVPVRKAIIHFEVDAIDGTLLGVGGAPLVWNYDAPTESVNPQWGAMHIINFDVGIWASDDAGGTTARMRAYQELQRLFGFPNSITALKDATEGDDGYVELLRFSGGSFAMDTVAEIRHYRMVNCELEVRVFSRTPISDTPGPAIEEIVQAPNLSISPNLTIIG